ncbi:MAG: Uncharacterized protein G01um101429_800 [Parcubacteria group bacterium Gr01-1014_29]|nr:MAG: Uncharacterized protein G01um101429_800 [Parcubacteria group bacterium Gr01-1014_29]
MGEKFADVEGNAEVLKGKNVEILLKFQRHGLREGLNLTPEGREITRDLAEKSNWRVTDDSESSARAFDAAKAIGSPQGAPKATPENPRPMSRALETAHITAETVAGERAGEWKSRPEKRLNYENIKTPKPYNHEKIYNGALAAAIRKLGRGDLEQKDLTKEEKIQVTEEAQAVVIQHISSLDTPEAQVFKKENAGMFADLVEHYMDMTHYLNNDSKVLYVAGTHGGTMEWLLQEALVHTDAQGNKIVGFKSPDEIGGGFNSSDAYNVDIMNDENGDLKDLRVTFDNPERPQEEMHLDVEKIHELATFYRTLHEQPVQEGKQ